MPALSALVAQAQEHEPAGIEGVDGDSGYFTSEGVGRLLAAGVDVCIPDSNMACCLHRGLPVRGRTQTGLPVDTGERPLLSYDARADIWRCVEGNALALCRVRQDTGEPI